MLPGRMDGRSRPLLVVCCTPACFILVCVVGIGLGRNRNQAAFGFNLELKGGEHSHYSAQDLPFERCPGRLYNRVKTTHSACRQ